MRKICISSRPWFQQRFTFKLISNTRHMMRMSRNFPTPSLNVIKSDAADKCSSFKLFQQARIIQGASSGTFYLMPMLTRSLEKLYKVIDAEMYDIGAQKVSLPCLAPKTLWKASERWDLIGSELLKLQDRHENQHCLAPTHEEAITTLVKAMSPVSYKQLPVKLYQIGRKFRDEMRPKNGLLRCREFEMKDLYTFDADESSAIATYEEVSDAYRQIFQKLELDYYRVKASSGAMGGSLSHEFHLLSNAGEDILYKCSKCGAQYNQELIEENNSDIKYICDKGQTHNQPCEFEKVHGIEIAHSFVLGTKYSDIFDACYTDKQNKPVRYFMGCYGIGVTRLLAAAVEVLSVDNMIRWPRLISPYQLTVVPQKEGYKSDVTSDLAEKLCKDVSSTFSHLRTEVILDDRLKLSIGARVSQAKHLGIPYVVVLGKKSLEANPVYEFIDVYCNSTSYVTESELFQLLETVETV